MVGYIELTNGLKPLCEEEKCTFNATQGFSLWRKLTIQIIKEYDDIKFNIQVFPKLQKIRGEILGIKPKDEFSKVVVAGNDAQYVTNIPKYSKNLHDTVNPQFDDSFSIISEDNEKLIYKVLSREIIGSFVGLTNKKVIMVIEPRGKSFFEMALKESYASDIKRMFNIIEHIVDNLKEIY